MQRGVYRKLVAFVGLMLSMVLWLPTAGAQQRDKPAYAFRATVEKVDAKAKKLTVNKIDARLKSANGETGQGWVFAGSQTYGVDKAEVLDRLKAGDQITATIYDGDLTTLTDVQVGTASRNKSDSAQR